MIYQHPLAYLLGLEGVALLRAFAGGYDEEFVRARFAEIAALLASEELAAADALVPPQTTVDGYRTWAPTYDQPGNRLIDIEEPLVRSMIDSVPVGSALDVACGTGRHTGYLASCGHRVVGIDRSPDMLAVARGRVPDVQFLLSDLRHLPVSDGGVDLVVCALALTHVPDLRVAFAEFARVLTPGGHLIVSDAAGLAAGIRPPIVMAGPDGSPAYLPHRDWRAADYVQAALAAGLEVRRCEEPRVGGPVVDPDYRPSVAQMLDGDAPNIWWLHCWVPEATNAAMLGTPVGIIWQFRLGDKPSG